MFLNIVFLKLVLFSDLEEKKGSPRGYFWKILSYRGNLKNKSYKMASPSGGFWKSWGGGYGITSGTIIMNTLVKVEIPGILPVKTYFLPVKKNGSEKNRVR